MNAKIDRLKALGGSRATDQDAWGSILASVRRDIDDVDEVLTKFTMETRRWVFVPEATAEIRRGLSRAYYSFACKQSDVFHLQTVSRVI